MIRSFSCLALLGLVSFGGAGCDKGNTGNPTPAASASAALRAAPSASSTTPPKAASSGASNDGFSLVATWGKEIGLKTPESVLHDEASDIYFVSNIDGKPLDADGKGFIAKIAPESVGVELKFIEGGKKGVTLNAPKGMAFTGDVLWVADIDTVRTFDRKTGAPKGDVKVPGATFLNDVAVAADGTSVIVTDTGMKAGSGGSFEPANTDAVYEIDKDKKVKTLAKSAQLGHPNGVYVVGGKVWVVTFGTNELYELDEKGNRSQVTKLPKGGLDGLQMIGADFLVSSWDGQAIYRGRPGGTFTAVVENVKSPADFLFDKKRNRIVVPLFQEDEIRAYRATQ